MSRPATSRLKVNAVLGSPPTLEWRPVGDLLIDSTYQREVDTAASQSLIRKIAMYWDWGLCQPLTVSRRPDGTLTIVDGQHRASAAKLRGDIPHLPCVITSYSSAGDEAAAFVALNQMRRPLSALDLFKAAVAAEDSEALTVLKAITEAGLSLAKHGNYISWKAGEISNIAGILRYHRRSVQATRIALAAMGKAWPGEVLQYCGSVYPGFAAVAIDEVRLRGNPDDVVRDLAHVASQRSQIEWRRAAQAEAAVGSGSTREGAETAFRRAYRARHLPDTGLPRPAAASIDLDQLAWCHQCDRRVSGEQASRCTSQFCSLKAKAA